MTNKPLWAAVIGVLGVVLTAVHPAFLVVGLIVAAVVLMSEVNDGHDLTSNKDERQQKKNSKMALAHNKAGPTGILAVVVMAVSGLVAARCVGSLTVGWATSSVGLIAALIAHLFGLIAGVIAMSKVLEALKSRGEVAFRTASESRQGPAFCEDLAARQMALCPTGIPDIPSVSLEAGQLALCPGEPQAEKEPLADERITVLPVAAATLKRATEWHVIHDGNERGPLSLAELVEMADAGEIEAEDLVKQSGGLWTKVGEVGFLRKLVGKPSLSNKAQIGRTFSRFSAPAIIFWTFLVFLLVLVSCYMTSRLLSEKKDSEGMGKVLVAKMDLGIGQRFYWVPEEFFEVKDIQQNLLPKDAITDFKDLRGRILCIPRRQGEWITKNELDFDAPLGHRAVRVKVNNDPPANGWASLPHSRVDIFLNPRKGDNKQSGSQVILQNVLVLAIDDKGNRDENGRPIASAVIILALTPENAETIDVARNTGTLSFMTRVR